MCRGHDCLACGSYLVYRNQAYGFVCMNVSIYPSWAGSECTSRQLRACPLCQREHWASNLRFFMYGVPGQGWTEVVPGAYSAWRRESDRIASRAAEQREQAASNPTRDVLNEGQYRQRQAQADAAAQGEPTAEMVSAFRAMMEDPPVDGGLRIALSDSCTCQACRY